MTTELKTWLQLTQEDPIDPGLPICDPHHHLWDHPNNRYLLDDLLQDTGGGHNIVSTVFLECRSMYREGGPPEMQPVGETEFVQKIANQSASGGYGKTRIAAGIVGFADLTLGTAVMPVLEAHLEVSPERFRGIRHISAWDASSDIVSYLEGPHLLLDPRFREGFACLKKYGLSFDSWLYHPQLMELVDLARTFPDISIIVDHVGGPLGIGSYAGKRKEVFAEWKRGMAELATCPNVVMKLGGLGMAICGFGWHERVAPPGSEEMATAMSPYYNWCIEKFGVNRCMFESNFPVDKRYSSYTVLWNAFKRIAGDFSPEDKAALFHDTAVRVYRL